MIVSDAAIRNQLLTILQNSMKDGASLVANQIDTSRPNANVPQKQALRYAAFGTLKSANDFTA